MKFFREYFWGVFLIFSGVVILLKLKTNLNISAIRVIGGFFFVYLGLSIMLGGFSVRTEKDLIFADDKIKPIELNREYNIVFSNGVIDLSDINLDTSKSVDINCVFGKGTVYISRDTPVLFKGNAAFANLTTPDGHNIYFGDYNFGYNFKLDVNYLHINANSVFAKLDIVYK